jgi:hypothetical protein
MFHCCSSHRDVVVRWKRTRDDYRCCDAGFEMCWGNKAGKLEATAEHVT